MSNKKLSFVFKNFELSVLKSLDGIPCELLLGIGDILLALNVT